MKELRRAERHRIRFKMVFDDGETYSAGYVRDISRTGLFLETASPLPVDSEVRLEPVDQQDALFEVSARVVRVVESDEPIPDAETHVDDGQIGMGLEFLALDGDAQDSIDMMIQKLEDAQRHAGDNKNFDPFLGVFVEDAPVGGELRAQKGPSTHALGGHSVDLEETSDEAPTEDMTMDLGSTDRPN